MPKLTLRDLFAVVTIVALALGWWLDRSRLARENWRLYEKVNITLSDMLDLKNERDVLQGRLEQ